MYVLEEVYMFVTLYMYMYVVLDAHVHFVDEYNVHAVTVYIPVGLQCDIQRQEITPWNLKKEPSSCLSFSLTLSSP